MLHFTSYTDHPTHNIWMVSFLLTYATTDLHYGTKIVLRKKKKRLLLNRKRKKSEALCTAPKIALLGAGCACLHGDGEHSPLGATGVL